MMVSAQSGRADVITWLCPVPLLDKCTEDKVLSGDPSLFLLL